MLLTYYRVKIGYLFVQESRNAYRQIAKVIRNMKLSFNAKKTLKLVANVVL